MAILMSSARNSRTLLDGLAFALGLVVGPIVAAQKIGLDLMWTGLIAGTIAYAGPSRARGEAKARMSVTLHATLHDLGPMLALILFGFLPNEVWRLVGLMLVRGLDEKSQIIVWVRAVATAMLAGVLAQLILSTSGPLASIPVSVRIGARRARLCRVPDRQALGVRRRADRRSRGHAGNAICLDLTSALQRRRELERVVGQHSGFSFSLAGGFIGTPALRGMTCTCRWNTTWPPALSLNCWIVMPSAPNTFMAALGDLLRRLRDVRRDRRA